MTTPACGEPGHDPGCDVPWGPPLTETDYAAMTAHIHDIEAGWQAEADAREASSARIAAQAELNEAEAGVTGSQQAPATAIEAWAALASEGPHAGAVTSYLAPGPQPRYDTPQAQAEATEPEAGL